MMKVLLIQSALLWLALVAEQARTDLIPAFSLLLPLGGMILIANKSTFSIVVVGLAFVLLDFLRMETLPVVTVGVLVLGTFVVTRQESDPLSRRSGSRRSIVPQWFLQSAIIVIFGILLHFGQQVYQQTFEIQNLRTHLIVSLPAFLLSAAALRISREFGFRFAID